MRLLVSKRHAQLLALLCLLLGSTLPSRPTSAEAAPSHDPLALREADLCDPKLTVGGGAPFFSGAREGYVVGGLKRTSGHDWLGSPRYIAYLSAGGANSPFASADLGDLQEGVPIGQKARLFMTGPETLVLFYYDKGSSLKVTTYRRKYPDGSMNNTLYEDKANLTIPDWKAMDDRNVPLWDIVANEKGFYTPAGCMQINGNDEIAAGNSCRRDCLAIDHYCIYDGPLKMNLVHEQSPNLEGGPRFSHPGLRHNSLYCNTFTQARSKDNRSMVLIRNGRKVDKPECYFDDDETHTQVQIWNARKWPNPEANDECLDLNGTKLGRPVINIPVPIGPPLPTSTGNATSPSGSHDRELVPFTLFALVVVVLMTLLLIAMIATYFKGKEQVTAISEYDEVY